MPALQFLLISLDNLFRLHKGALNFSLFCGFCKTMIYSFRDDFQGLEIQPKWHEIRLISLKYSIKSHRFTVHD